MKADAKKSVRSADKKIPVRLTHPERVLFSDPPITKQKLADFYRGIAEFILPGLVNRPLMLLRCPQGASGECFFQKHVNRALPAQLREVNDRKDRQRWIYLDCLEGLLALVQMNCLEFHVWGATGEQLERPARAITARSSQPEEEDDDELPFDRPTREDFL